MQVKSRSIREGRRDSNFEAAAWLYKHIDKAVRQGRGSKRSIATHHGEGRPLSAVPVRALVLGDNERDVLEVALDTDCSTWPIIVVVSHPDYHEAMLPVYDDAFCITMGDWHELNRHLRSTHEVLRYAKRVIANGADVAVPLGREFERFASLVEYDKEYAMQAKGARPWTSFDAVADPVGIEAYRELLDRTWGPNDIRPGVNIQDYRSVLDFLDDVPASAQAHVGRWVISQRAELRKCRHRVSGSTLLVDRPLIYMCDFKENQPDLDDWIATIFGLVGLRAAEWREQIGNGSQVLGIGVRVMDDASDEYTYMLAESISRMPMDLRRSVEWSFGTANFKTFKTWKLRVGRNEICPCGSGRKYKRCHGARQPLEPGSSEV